MHIKSPTVRFELAEAVTRDGLVHQGLFSGPEGQGKRAVLWIHGLTGRFYGDVTLMNGLAAACNAKGMAFAVFNTRGHDIIANLKKVDPNEPSGFGHVMTGAGMEVFEESVFDIDAGISFLVSRGYSEVILMGHSSGANKVCYYAGKTKDPRVAGVVLAGPMSDRLSQHTDKEKYAENLALLRDLIETGRGDALLTQTFWFPTTAKRAWSLLAPNTKEDVFNYGDAKQVLSVFHGISAPLLVVFAGRDEAADRPIDQIRKVFDLHSGSTNYRSIVIADATHGYDGKQREFVDAVSDWAATV